MMNKMPDACPRQLMGLCLCFRDNTNLNTYLASGTSPKTVYFVGSALNYTFTNSYGGYTIGSGQTGKRLNNHSFSSRKEQSSQTSAGR